MPIVQLRDGSYARTEDDLSPQELRKLGARVPVSTSSRPRPVNPIENEARARVAKQDKLLPMSKYGAADKFSHEYTFHLDEPISAAASALTRGGYNAFKKGDIGEIGKEYKVAKRAQEIRRRNYEDENTFGGNAMGLLGAIVNPLGAETGVSKVLAKVAPNLTKAAKATKFVQAVGKAGNTAIGQGARAGFNQAALTDIADTGSIKSALNSGLMGATLGGTLSAAGKAGSSLYKVFKDRAPDAAKRVAYDKIAEMLGRTRRPGAAHMPYSPAAAQREMAVSAAAGHDPMLMDLSPEMHNTGGWLARKPGLKAANELVDAGEVRAAGAADRFDTEVTQRMGRNPSAYEAKKSINATRRARGQVDYAEGGALDMPVKWSKDLEDFFNNSPDAGRLMQKAYTSAQRFGEPIVGGTAKDGTQFIPSMRAFDRLKREFDGEIGVALRKGDKTLASGLSEHLKRLKGLMTDANPEYAGVLAAQRDEFEKLASAELGQSIFTRMKSREGAEQLLDEIKAGKTKPGELRVGVSDALLSMRNTADNPVALMRKFMRSKEQRAVLETVMGGKKELNRFDRFMRREIRGGKSNAMLGKQSATNIFQQVGDDAGEAAGDIGRRAVTGFGFGGVIGGLSGLLRGYHTHKATMGPAAREELARILMGRGEGLQEGISAAKKHSAGYKKFEQDLARMLAKAGAYSVSGVRGE